MSLSPGALVAQAPMPCPVCGGVAPRPFREEAGHTIVACGDCGLRYLDPQPSAEAVMALYAEHYYHSDDPLARGYARYTAEAENWRLTFRDRLKHLGAPQGPMLDVGAAAGFFVEQARAAGWDATGVEPSEWASGYAREQLHMPVTTGTLEAQAYADGAYAAVTMWEVIEHLPDPKAFLAEVARVLAPGGLLALSTPDAGAPVSRLAGSRWLGWQKVPEHLTFFDKATLTRLLEASGFEIQTMRYVSLTVTLGFALERLGALVGLPWLGQLPAALAKRSVAVNPGYDLMVLARRR